MPATLLLRVQVPSRASMQPWLNGNDPQKLSEKSLDSPIRPVFDNDDAPLVNEKTTRENGAKPLGTFQAMQRTVLVD